MQTICNNAARSARAALILWPVTWAAWADAQQFQQTIQLPTFHQFGVSTTVLVPDRGSVVLGGVTRSAIGRSNFNLGWPTSGRAMSTGSVSIHATIIDHDAIDRALLAEAARRRGADVDVLGRPVPPAAGGRASRSPSTPRRRVAQAANAASRQAATYLRRARAAESAGQIHAAQIFYRRVVKHAHGDLRRHAEAKLAAIDSRIVAAAARH